MTPQPHLREDSGATADPDAALVAAARGGDSAAFSELVQRYDRRIFRLAQRVTQNREDAEDAMQEAFIKAYQKLDTFRGQSRFYSWLVRIAFNEALMNLRKRRPNQDSLDEPKESEGDLIPQEIEDWGPTPEQKFAQTELQEILSTAVGSLDPAYRVVFLLRDEEQFSIEETAAMLGLSVPAVKSRLLRARLMLREKLNPYFAKEPQA